MQKNKVTDTAVLGLLHAIDDTFNAVRDYNEIAEILFTHNYRPFFSDEQHGNIVNYMAATYKGWDEFIKQIGRGRAWEQMEHLISNYWGIPEKLAEGAQAKETFEAFQQDLHVLYQKLPHHEVLWY